jgi:putative SOS response-associated peptidase YedK
MCSRYSLTAPPEAVRAIFGTQNALDFPPRYNIAPTQPVLIVRRTPQGEREQYLVRWGLIPSWVKDPRDFTTLINARSETASEKPSFRGAFRHRRCLVPATGFYEWTGKPGAKRPHMFRARDGGLIALAGIADHWVGADGSELETVAILTTTANATMAPIHDRMPVIIAPEHFDVWLDCRSGTSKYAETLLSPPPPDLLEIIDVSPKLNNPRNEGPELLQSPGAV